MAYLASAVMLNAAKMLNDAGQSTYTNTLLLPHLQNAWRRLSLVFQENDLPYTDETSSDLDVPAGTTAINAGSTPAIPADLITPYQIWEKPDGASATQYQPMTQVSELPFRDQDTTLGEWKWEEGEIKLVGATVAVDVRISYEKHLSAIASENTNIYLMDAELFLAAQTAAFAALILGGNVELSTNLQGMADDQIKRIVNNRVKQMQNLPARRKPYGFYRRLRRM